MMHRSQFSRFGIAALGAPALAALLLAGCASEPRAFEGAFSADQQVQGTADSIPASVDTTWSAAMEVLTHQGFVIQQADSSDHVILATRELHEDQDADLSYTISAALTLVPTTDRTTRVMMAANQTTEMHQREHTWWHLLWIIPLFPTGTNFTTVVTDRDTVQSPRFYSDFFEAVKASAAAMPVGAQSVADG